MCIILPGNLLGANYIFYIADTLFIYYQQDVEVTKIWNFELKNLLLFDIIYLVTECYYRGSWERMRPTQMCVEMQPMHICGDFYTALKPLNTRLCQCIEIPLAPSLHTLYKTHWMPVYS
jgi:hypothetical protein